MHGTCLEAGTVSGEGSFHGGGGMRTEVRVGEDLVEVGWSAELDRRESHKEIVNGWV